ncbi:LysR family transcriptional regulator [Rhodococcus sp. 06-462-5]|uniref:LysR family transcriptional regulator n=1 Tax=Nocardiaceae TaxID=85025 RepID=UPI00050CD1B9|nr:MULTISPECIES: LysR family transcriptional regulator [Rhodococcus]OZC74013.1 LysR family transcriptional regulator [Rhodococcus sp. 06-462-5]OZE68009.1 LysR family transcriptional regulator [Rhodococcus sp. 02-925g]OZF51969.1 LysR family transcriptional regulator [Rhodococcus sp. 14-1411-2a]
MDPRVLQLFLTLADEQHYGRAAKRSHIAQPALSQHIIQLEAELGVRLFDRSTRRVVITEAGTRFAEHARRIIDSLKHAKADMRAFASGYTGRVSVGFVGTATYDVLPLLAHRVREQLPDIDLELRGELLTPQLLDGLSAGVYDLVLVRPRVSDHHLGDRSPGSDEDQELVFERLRTERLMAVLPVSSPMAERNVVDLSDLAAEPFVTHPSKARSTMHRRVIDACASAGFTPHTIEVSETATLVVSVAAGLGVALAPEPVRHLGLDGVVYKPLATTETVELSLARRKNDMAPAVSAVAALVRSVVRTEPPEDQVLT